MIQRYEELLSNYMLNRFAENLPIVAYQNFEDDRIVQVQIIGKTGKTPLILLNAKLLSSKQYFERVKDLLKQCCSSNILGELGELGMDISASIVLYVAASVEYGHCNPNINGYIHMEDWETYAGERMWAKAYADIQERLSLQRQAVAAS